MADLDAFRSEVRAWIEANAPESLRGKALDLQSVTWGGRKVPVAPDRRLWLDRMAERGWTAPTWPTEYAGGGLSSAEAAVLQQEIGRLKLPAPLTGMGLSMIGPTLLQHGSEEQKREYLPKIVHGDMRWCQGYSEPNAGSDLAALQMSAVRDGDEYVVNGQKTWTTGANFADWMFALVRTDSSSKHQGITFLLIDMDSPGIEVRPIRLISGNSPFCETFFSDVRVPAKNVVGQVNAGWTIGKTLLGFERSGISGMGGAGGEGPARSEGRGGAMPLADVARRYVGEAQGKLADPVLRDRMAQLGMDQKCFQLTAQRAADGRRAGHAPGSETSLFKLYSTELGQRREELLLSMRGPQALGWEGEGFEAEELAQTRGWLGSRAITIYGGTTEIQLNIIAKRVLGLPDDPGG